MVSWLINLAFYFSILDGKYAWNNAITVAYASNAGQCLYIVSLYPGLFRNNILNLFEENSSLHAWCIIDHHNYWAMTVCISLYPCKSSRKEEFIAVLYMSVCCRGVWLWRPIICLVAWFILSMPKLGFPSKFSTRFSNWWTGAVVKC